MIDSGELAAAMVQALQLYHQTQAIAASQPRVDKLNITVKEPSIPQLPSSGIAQISTEPESAALPSGIIDLSDLVRSSRPSVNSITLAIGPSSHAAGDLF